VMSGTSERRPLRYRGVRLRSDKPRPLAVAVVTTVIAVYLGVDIVLVATRSQRHFSTAAWAVIACLTILAAWVAVRSWREVAASRRQSS
jgi:uncharacterized membrane protein